MAQDSRPPTFATIPVPVADPDGLYHTCMAMKEAIETMQGLRGNSLTPRLFTGQQPPRIDREGDFWLSTGQSTTLNVAYAGKWFRVGVLQ